MSEEAINARAQELYAGRKKTGEGANTTWGTLTRNSQMRWQRIARRDLRKATPAAPAGPTQSERT